MKENDSAFWYICDSELQFYKALDLHEKINYKSNWWIDPVNGNLQKMICFPNINNFLNSQL